MNYEAANLEGKMCSDFEICRDCVGPAPPPGEQWFQDCAPVAFQHYYVSEYYAVVGATQMKAELLQHGPIECGIEATKEFDTTYFGGIYS